MYTMFLSMYTIFFIHAHYWRGTSFLLYATPIKMYHA